MNSWKAYPKVELHLHLDCSLSYQAVQQLDPSVTREDFERDFVAPAKCTSLVDFLSRTPAIIALLQTEAGLRLAVNDLMDQLHDDGVVYAEIRFAPFLHTEHGLAPAEVVRIVEEELERAVDRTGVEGYLILCTLRHFTTEQSLVTAQLVHQFQGSRVVALDIAGDEAGYPIQSHIPAFHYARTHDINRTAHAGEAKEAAGAHSVWETLKHFKPSRIGHGVRSNEDEALINHLREQGIHLEVCPTCNVQIDIYKTYAEHPIDSLYRQGVQVGINTDTRTITNITLSQEYARIVEVFGWTAADLLQCNLNAIRAAFAPEQVRQAIEAKLVSAWEKSPQAS